MRSTGVVDDARVLRARDHVAWCDQSSGGLAEAVAAVFAAAGDDEQLMFVCEGAPEEYLDQVPDAERMMSTGRLLVGDTRDLYRPVVADADFDARAQLAVFDGALDVALAQGYTGMRVVADNTAMLRGDDAMTQRWHEWEQVTDRWQSGRPIIGVCWFDRSQITPERLSQVVGLHPRLRGVAASPLRIINEPDMLVLQGAAEAHDEARLRRAFALGVVDDRLVVDLAEVAYLHHRVVLDLARLTARGTRVELRNAPSIVRRVCSVLRNETALLEFV